VPPDELERDKERAKVVVRGGRASPQIWKASLCTPGRQDLGGSIFTVSASQGAFRPKPLTKN
jgi:hypothetical protein